MDTDKPDWHFLINPAAGRGKARQQWQKMLPHLRAALPGMSWAASSETTGLTELAETAIRAGHFLLVGVGGDGTHHEVINGIMAAGAINQVTYAPLPLGTGNDWVRTLRTPRNIAKWVEMLRVGKSISHGVGELKYQSLAGQSMTRYFLNVAGMAYDAEVVRRSEAAPLKHRFLYPLYTLLFLRGFQVPAVRIDYDDHSFTGPVHTVNFGIGRYNGGGMRLVPQAEPTAKTIALTYARQLPVWKILLESWRFYTGSIEKVTEVTATHAHRITVTPVSGEVALEADGEWLGVAPVKVRLLTERLKVIVDGHRFGALT